MYPERLNRQMHDAAVGALRRNRGNARSAAVDLFEKAAGRFRAMAEQCEAGSTGTACRARAATSLALGELDAAEELLETAAATEDG